MPTVIKCPEIQEQICDLLATGHTLRSICAEDGNPSLETVRRWLISDDSFRGQYARARKDQADYFADEIIDLSDAVSGSTEPAIVNAARLAIDARKWHAAKTEPKKYGDVPNKTEVNVSTAIVVLDQTRLQELQDRKAKAEPLFIKNETLPA